MTIVREKLLVCKTPGCPWPEDEEMHVPWCLGIPGVEHRREATHQHTPKKGMGGSNPKSKIRAILCPICHDRCDNGDWANNAIPIGGTIVYRLWDIHNKTLVERSYDDPFKSPRDHAQEAEPVLRPLPEAGDTGLPVLPGRKVAALGDGAAEGGLEHEQAGDTSHIMSALASTDPARNFNRRSERLAKSGLLHNDRNSDGIHGRANFQAQGLVPELLELPGEMTRSQAVEIAQHIRQSRERSPWLAGDLLNAAEERWSADPYGESWTDTGDSLVDVLGLKYPSARNYQRVCEAISNTRRRGIPFSHWAILYRRTEEEQETCVAWLLASDPMPSVGKLRALLGTARETVKRYTIDGLRESLQIFHAPALRNHGRRFAEAFLGSLE